MARRYNTTAEDPLRRAQRAESIALLPRMRAVPVTPPKRYWHAVRQSTRDHDTLLIMDEIPKGATGKMQRIGMAEKLGLA